MRCKMCGAKLKKQGDICKNCYEEYKEYERLKQEKEEEILCVKRKYSPKFNLLKNGEMLVLLLIVLLAGFGSYGTGGGILIAIVCVLFFGLWMFFNKKRAMGTKTVFYQTKLRYTAQYLLVDKDEIIPYDDIKDMAYFQTFSQKVCQIGDIRFYTKGFLSGLTIHDIPEIGGNFEKMRQIIDSTRNNHAKEK